MASGKVKWFDNKKGFGFIEHESDADVFVHYSSIQGDGFRTLAEGEQVTYELIQSDKGLKAQNVTRSENPPHSAPLPPPRASRPHHAPRPHRPARHAPRL
ncbi:MAG: cold shock domain-containing protein [Verrucomicrobia bacterium]|nr:cold shock domain-containing protein [Verrucomicrobiota bacterium]